MKEAKLITGRLGWALKIGKPAAVMALGALLAQPSLWPAPPAVSILVSFRLDPWLISGNYGGGFWVSPSVLGPVNQPGNAFSIEVRAGGVDAQGQSVAISPQWTPSDPDMVAVSSKGPNSAVLTVQRPGYSTVEVAYPGASTRLSVEAVSMNQGNSMQVVLTQTPNPGLTPGLMFNFPPDAGVAATSGIGPLSTGYGRLSMNTDAIAIANFSYSSADAGSDASALITEAGVPAAAVVTSARLFVDYNTGSNSGFALVNPNSSAINVRADLTDAKGAPIASTVMRVAPGGHAAMFADELAPGLPNPFLGSLTLTSANGFAAVNLKAVTNGRNEMLFSSLPVADPSNPPARSELILAQVVDGGGIPTEILLMNPSGGLRSAGRVEMFDDNGAPLPLDFGDPGGPQSALSFSIEPDGIAKFSTTGMGNLRVGYAVVTVDSGPLPVGNSVFQFVQNSEVVSQAAVQDSPPTAAARMFVETASAPLALDTGVAMVNPGEAAVVLDLALVGLDGSNRTRTFKLGPKEHTAEFITELFPGLPAAFRGVLDVTASQPASLLTLRLAINKRGETIYSTLPVMDLSRPTGSASILPHIVNGGGYRTQIIVLGGSVDTGTISISFYDKSGKLLPPSAFSFN